ncbi:NcpA protein [Candidatus Vecturithrix granuli]|uniref:NcpA protein n=1 Tax=Vecturithrix granuli TaxID=1499967 RepID=A0A0S6W9Y7_VECG1|nr:NcpA protein [Candidatus Vecturithrix granuli]
MRPVSELLADLRNSGVHILVNGEELHLNAPKGSLTPDLRAEIAQRKADILAFFRAVASGGSQASSPIPVVPRDTPLPLSFAQQRLWFLHQFEEEQRGLYNVSKAFQLHGRLDIQALEQNVSAIVRRHEVLRTSFAMHNGDPVQTILTDARVPFSIRDLQDLSPQEQADSVQHFAVQEAQRPFDLEQGPLLRVLLLRVAPTDHVVVLTIHHIVSDAWSTGILFQELAHIYQAWVTGEPVSLPDLPIQYADFAVWQRNWLQGDRLERLTAYWKNQLEAIPPILELSIEHPRPAIQSFQGKTLRFSLNAALCQKLTTLSQQAGATLFMTLLAAFVSLLARYSGSNDIVVGSPIANRRHPALESLIGFFVNTLVLRVNVAENPTFLDVLQQVRKVTLEAYDHQDLPFERLVEVLQPERNLHSSPLFQVMFVFQNAPKTHMELSGLTVKSLEFDPGIAKFDLTLGFIETEHGTLDGTIEYATDLFDAETITRMIGHLQTILTGIVQDPQKYISDLPLLTQAERQQILEQWNDTHVSYAEQGFLPELFEAQVQHTPDATAVVFNNTPLTYQELNQRANHVAHYLRSLGVGPEVLVGIFVERSLEMMVGLLGILKAGGAYVPLDPEFPQARLQFMIDNSGVSVLLTQKALEKKLPSNQSQKVFLDADWENIAVTSEGNLVHGLHGANLAYVIYTSGSTGLPKGVQISHNALRNFLLFMRQQLGVTARDALLAVTTLSFDIAGLELFLPLIAGGTVVLADRETTLDGRRLSERLEQCGVTVMQATPATWRLMLASGWRNTAELRALCGGEALPRDLAAQLLNGVASLKNLYGPTETTIWSSLHQVTSSDQTIPIGRPIGNTQFYILDASFTPTPVGVAGELYIGGAGLARGYFKRPDLTAEKFVPHPLSSVPGERLYKTGDQVRYLPDGNIEFLGRRDDQVKIRGFRIELGEIETALSEYPAIRQAVVVVQGDDLQSKRIAAYLVPQDNSVSIETLQGFLKEKLPDYMIPSVFVFLDALPLTPNGKIDRRALPSPGSERPRLQAQYVAPRTPVEDLLIGIWSDLLELEHIGIHDDFFQSGGHSLLGTQLISRISQTFGIHLPLRVLFDRPTVAGLAELIANNDILLGQETMIPRAPFACAREYKEGFPLSYAQQRLWFFEQLEPGNAVYNFPMMLQLNGQLHISALQQSLDEVVRRHEILRAYFVTIHGEPRQRIAPVASIPVLIRNLQHLSPTEQIIEVQRLVVAEVLQGFDLARGPLLRASLLQLAESEYILFFMIHHIVFDEWSKGVLLWELSMLYEAFAAGKPSPLAELPIQYTDFACWQRQQLQGKVFEVQLDYWKKTLAGKIPLMRLPTDRPRPRIQTFQGATYSFMFSQSLMKTLKILSQHENVTLFMTLLAAWKILLYHYTGLEDVFVGTLIANRNVKESEDLIGFFANTLVLRTDLSGNPTFRELLRRVREVTLGAYSHQDMPIEKLVEILQPARSLRYHPFFQVLFVFQNTPMEKLELPGVSVTTLKPRNMTALFDLELYIREAEEGLQGNLEYKTDLFDEATMIRLIQHFQTILETGVAHPDWRMTEFPRVYPTKQEQNNIPGILSESDLGIYPIPSVTANASISSLSSPENTLCAIWSKILGVKDVDIYDNFFELGGYSLLAAQLIFQVNAVFHVEIALRSFFENPTVAGLTQIISRLSEQKEVMTRVRESF